MIVSGFLAKIKIRNQILLLLSLPILGLIFFAGNNLQRKIQTEYESRGVIELSRLAAYTSALLHEQQKERGATAGFIGSNGQKFVATLRNQRPETDKRKQDLKDFLSDFDASKFGKELSTKLNKLETGIAKMPDIRNQVDNLSINVGGALKYYTGLNTDILDLIGIMLKIPSKAESATEISAYVNFLQSKERAGIERAVGSYGFTNGFNYDTLARLTSLIAIQDTYMKIFKTYADRSHINFYNKTLSGRAIDEVERMRAIAFKSLDSNDYKNVEASYWFDTMTKKINLLKQVEDSLSESILQKAQERNAAAKNIKYVYIAALIVGTTILTLFSWSIIRNLVNSIKYLTESLTKLADNDTAVTIRFTGYRNQIGHMARAIEILKEGLIRKQELEEEQIQNRANEQKRRREERQRVMNELADSLEGTISGAITKVFDTAEGLSRASNEMSTATASANQKSFEVASTSGETSANVQTVAGATEEMTASIREIAQQITKSKQVVESAVDQAESADNSAQTLSKAVDSIGEVTELINDITDKINMLALNATIESARAGEAGKGFAVVANEVKDLANQTSTATKDIAREIANIQAISNDVISVMQKMREAISSINEYSSSIATAVEEQSAVTNEISMNMMSASDGVQLISNHIEDVKEAAKLADSSASEVLNASQLLSEQATLLESESRSFIDGIRKAS